MNRIVLAEASVLPAVCISLKCGCAAGSIPPVDLPSGSKDAVQAALTAAMGMTVSCDAHAVLYSTKFACMLAVISTDEQLLRRCTIHGHKTWSAHDLLLVLVQVRMVHLSKSTNASISTKDPTAVPLPVGMGNHGSPVIGAQCCVLLQRITQMST